MKKIESTYDKIALELANLCSFEDIKESLKRYIVDEIRTSDINKLLVKASVDLISIENIHWQFIA
jgi:hypothetical protein